MTMTPDPIQTVQAAWTPEPWRHQCETTHEKGRPPITRHEIYTSTGRYGHPATCAAEPDAARIVACVNAMAGIADPATELARLRAENARLTGVVERLIPRLGGHRISCPALPMWIDDRKVIGAEEINGEVELVYDKPAAPAPITRGPCNCGLDELRAAALAPTPERTEPNG